MADSGGGTQTRAHKKKLEQGARVPNQRDLGLMSTGKQGLCRAGIALAAVGPGGWTCPWRVRAALSPAAAAPLTAAVTQAQPRTRPLLQGRLREPRGQGGVC